MSELLIPVTNKNELTGTIICEQEHAKYLSMFQWHGKEPFFEAPRAHLVFTDAEREHRFREGLGSSRAYSFAPARLAWLLMAEPDRIKALLSYWQATGYCSLLSDELKRPFRILYRTSNKLDVRANNIKCPAMAMADELPECVYNISEESK